MWMIRVFMLLLLVAIEGAAFGQNYPTRTIRIVTTPAGGSLDLETRLIAQGITGPLGQAVVVDNRAGNLIGEAVAKSPPDGYMLLNGGNDFMMAPLLKPAPYDPIKDFAPIVMTVEKAPNILVVNPSVPVNNVKELIALAKAKPGELNYAYAGQGGALQLAGELFKSMAGVKIQSINYKGAAPALNALLAGDVQLMFADMTAIAQQAKTGKVRALAVTSAQPSPLYPSLPTISASGLPGYERSGFDAIMAPVGTPSAVITRLNQEIVRVLKTPEIKDKLFNVGSVPLGSTPEEAAARMKNDIAKTAQVIKDAGIAIE